MKKLVFNPFEDYTEKQLAVYGVAITISGALLGMQFDARYDGLLDLHFSENSGYEPFYDILIAIACSLLVFFTLGKIINRKTRLIDILSMSMIARFPIYLLTFFNTNGYMSGITDRLMQSMSPADIDAIATSDLTLLLVFSMLSLVFMIWFFVLLWNGFRVATNARGTRHILYFIIAILIGEIISKIIFMQL